MEEDSNKQRKHRSRHHRRDHSKKSPNPLSDVPVRSHIRDPTAAEDAEKDSHGVVRKSVEEAFPEILPANVYDSWLVKEDSKTNDPKSDLHNELELSKTPHGPDADLSATDPNYADSNTQRHVTLKKNSRLGQASDVTPAPCLTRSGDLERKPPDLKFVVGSSRHGSVSPATDDQPEHGVKPREQQAEVVEELSPAWSRPQELPKIIEMDTSAGATTNDSIGDSTTRLNNMLKRHHHLKVISPTYSPDEARSLRHSKHDLRDDSTKASTEPRRLSVDPWRYLKHPPQYEDRHEPSERQLSDSEGQDRSPRLRRSTERKKKDRRMVGADEFYLTELDGPASDPAQPPIIRASQRATTAARYTRSVPSSSSSDKRVSFNLEKNLLQQCTVPRPQNDFYGKPNQKRKQQLRNIAYSSRSISAKREGALDFDPKEKSGMSSRRSSRRSTGRMRPPSAEKQGSRARRDVSSKPSNVVITTSSGRPVEKRPITGNENIDDADANELAQMLTKATNSCKVN